MKRLRNSKSLVMEAAEYSRLQREYLAWIDARVRAHATAAMMNAELASARLLFPQPEPDIADMLTKSYAGYLAEIQSSPADAESDLTAITFGIHTGASCGFDETLALYSRRTLQRLARINAKDDSQPGWLAPDGSVVQGWHLRGYTIGRDDASRGRSIGSAWVVSNCTSNWNGESIRLDILQGNSTKNILSAPVAAFLDDEMRILIEGDTITFTYTSTIFDGTAELRPAINRYRVRDGRAVREAPLARSYGGFIDEWLKADNIEAARWSSPEAALQHRDLAAKYQKEMIRWEHVSACPGTPPAREISVRWEDSKQTTVFLIGGDSAAEMRMLSISDKRLPSCREIAIGRDRSSIMAEPSR
ncbi:MAG TPA: hypothetical protein VKU19_36410 [Bryobacteraceae bacterium]|nr:hypothetical protein [Bryobacteraceae bacterium]